MISENFTRDHPGDLEISAALLLKPTTQLPVKVDPNQEILARNPLARRSVHGVRREKAAFPSG